MTNHFAKQFRNSLLIAVCLFFVFCNCSNPLLGQDDAKFTKKLDELVQPYLDNKKFFAASLAIVRKGKVYTRSYGQMSEADKTKPDADTIYEIGSISKVFTGILLADAVEQEKVKLDQTLGTLVEGLAETDEEIANSITLQHLSHHMSGLPRMPANMAPADPNNPFDGYDRKMLQEYLKSTVTISPPGEKYNYSNLGVGLLGDLLSQQAGKSYEQLLAERIFQPLEMKDSSLNVPAEKMKRFAPPHNSTLAKDYCWDFDALAGCGAIRSSVNDMAKFMQANIDPPENEIGKAINLAWKKSLDAATGHSAMGLGWTIAADGSTRWHNGRTGGYQTMMLVSRDLDTGVVMLSNTAGSEVDPLAESIFQMAVGMEVKPREFVKQVDVDEMFVQRLVGKYRLAPGVIIDVVAKGNRMTAQITGQQALSIVPEKETVWRYELVEAKLVFDVPDEGPATKVTLKQNGRNMVSPRIED